MAMQYEPSALPVLDNSAFLRHPTTILRNWLVVLVVLSPQIFVLLLRTILYHKLHRIFPSLHPQLLGNPPSHLLDRFVRAHLQQANHVTTPSLGLLLSAAVD
jgi:hypothetical protein